MNDILGPPSSPTTSLGSFVSFVLGLSKQRQPFKLGSAGPDPQHRRIARMLMMIRVGKESKKLTVRGTFLWDWRFLSRAIRLTAIDGRLVQFFWMVLGCFSHLGSNSGNEFFPGVTLPLDHPPTLCYPKGQSFTCINIPELPLPLIMGLGARG